MKKALSTIVSVIVALSFSSIVFAEGPETIDLPASMGKVSFPHMKHQEMLKDCKKCHEVGLGKIAALGKEWAHNTCKGCHTEMKKGPTSCKECHKK
jgi:predicted CXXCH cytochrome family protein